MPTLVEELLEAVLGPWGVAFGAAAVGIGVMRRRRAAAVRGPRPTLPDARALAAPGLGLGAWWRDVYAEAQAEWQAERSRPAPATTQTGAGRVRDARGRFIKPASGR